MITIIFTLELKSSIERTLMTVSTAAMIIYYVSEFSINLYFWFEAAGLPLLLSIFLLGRQPQKLEAGKYILFYVAIPRLPLLLIILRGSWRITHLFNCLAIWVILPFLRKIPCYLLHAWLPKAHVEASTIGSIVLAGSVMKMGRYGVLLSTPGNFMSIAIPPILISGVVLVGVVIIRGVDTKTLVAYSRVLHIAVGMMAWVSANFRGYAGTLFSNVAHSLLSPIMFLGVSSFYTLQGCRDRRGLRSWQRSGLCSVVVCIVFLINAGMPPWILSAREVVMVLACKEKVALTLGVVLGIFLSGLWTLVLAADQSRRQFIIPHTSSVYPISSGLLVSSYLPFLVI